MPEVTAVLTAVLVAITGWYAYTTHQMARAARDSAAASQSAIREANRAVIEIAFLKRGNLMLLRVENVGQRPANDLRVALNADIAWHDNTYARSQIQRNLLDRTISVLPMNRPHFIIIGTADQYRLTKKLPEERRLILRGSVRYNDVMGSVLNIGLLIP